MDLHNKTIPLARAAVRHCYAEALLLPPLGTSARHTHMHTHMHTHTHTHTYIHTHTYA